MRPSLALGTATDFLGMAPARALWALPWLVVVELVGSTYGAPLLVSLIYFAAVVLIASVGHRVAAASAKARGPSGPERWLLGVLLLGFGLALMAGFVMALCVGGSPRLVSPRPDIGLPLGLLGCWCVAIGVAWASGRNVGWLDLERFGLLLGFAFIALLAGGHRVQGLVVYPSDPWARGLAVLLALVVVGLAASAGKWLPERFFILVLAGIALRWAGLGVWQPDPAVRDMLPLIQGAGDALARGEHPYGVYQMQHGSLVPLTYLPGLWGLHNLPRLVGLPLRLSSLVADVVILVCFWWVAERRHGATENCARCLVIGLGAVWLLSPSVQWNFIYAEPHPWWGVMALTLASALRGKWMLSALGLGIAVATRQFAWFIAPIWVLWLWRAVGPHLAIRRVLVAAGIALGLIVPFAASRPDSFWFGTLRWFNDYGPTHRAWFLERLGFAGSLYARGLEGWLMPAQAVVAVVALGFAWHSKTERRLLFALTLGYALFVMFGLVIWDSFYLGVFVLLSLVTLGALGSRLAPTPVEAKRALIRLPQWLIAVAVVEGLMVVWLGYGFWETGSELGLRAAGAALKRHLKPRDVVLDAARRRLAFVQPPRALRAPQGALAINGEFEPNLGEWGWLAAPRLGLLYRAERDRDRAERLSRLGELVARGREGFYSWLLVERRDILGRLSDGLSAARFLSTDGRSDALTRRGDAYLSGTHPELAVERRQCLVGARQRTMLFSHPSDQGTLELSFVFPRTAKRLILVAGFDDRVVRWGRAGVELALWLKSRRLGVVEAANAPGPFWDVFEISKGEGVSHVALTLRTPDDRQRWLCLEGFWL